MADRIPTHTAIGRACGPKPDSACVQVKIAYYAEPEAPELEWIEDGLRKTFRNAFSEDAVRVGVAVLPYAEEHDGDEDGEHD
jgi:hypothetical protein